MTPATFENEDQATNWALDWLGSRGFTIQAPAAGGPEALTPRQFRLRYAPHLSAPGFSQRLIHPARPLFTCTRSTTGRLLTLTANPELIAWVARPSTAGRKLEHAA